MYSYQKQEIVIIPQNTVKGILKKPYLAFCKKTRKFAKSVSEYNFRNDYLFITYSIIHINTMQLRYTRS